MSYTTGAVLVALAGLLWSLIGLMLRQIEVADTWQILFWRSVGMVPVLLAVIALRPGGHPLRKLRRVGLAGVIGGCGLVFAFAGSIFALQATTVANAVFLFAASPFFAAVLGWLLLGERVRRATWFAIAVAGIGMFVMVREGLAAGALAGNAGAVLSALGFAVFAVALRWGRMEDMMPTVVLGGLFSIAVATVAVLAEGRPLIVPLPDMLWALGIGAVTLGIGMVLFTLGSRVMPAADLALLSMVEVLLAPIWVWYFLNETASPATFLGGAILLGAIAANALSGARRGLRRPVPGP